MNKDIILGIFIGFLLTVILLAVVLAGIGGFLLYQKVSGPNIGLPATNQSQGNGTLFGCPELKLAGTETVKNGVPFTIQNTDSKPHKISISGTEYSLAAGEEKTITISSGWGKYQVPCDGYVNVGQLNVGK